MPQRISIWRDDATGENIEADQSYFLAEVNQITRKTFDKSLANIDPCLFAKFVGTNQADASSVRLHPTHGFMWKRETLNTEPNAEDLNSLVTIALFSLTLAPKSHKALSTVSFPITKGIAKLPGSLSFWGCFLTIALLSLVKANVSLWSIAFFFEKISFKNLAYRGIRDKASAKGILMQILLTLGNDEDDHHIYAKCLEQNHGCLARV
ncbi:hypothetical protein MTR_2g461850 [Medicago truncatula]|uniref:Uncharacterized protein n=1 Tax=Medicago truncatula TaxID=3880 RepID=A0A072V9Q9_MEDTR|nr:hypothetical protein MTR_2g461850 [Medicago truncatula]